MKPRLFILLASSFLMISNVQTAQANLYSVNVVFTNDGYADSTFAGTFNYGGGVITNLMGVFTDNAMEAAPLALNYQNVASSSDGAGGVKATVFALNGDTNVFKQGGFDYAGGIKTYGNFNAYVTIDINASNPLLGPTSLNPVSAASGAQDSLMGSQTMAWHTNALTGSYGNMNDGRPISLTVAAVPEPEEWAMMLLGFGLVGYQVKRKQKKFTQAIV
ncbi:MAG: PEPxxWA-CTERM sorting domain-containing protein [Candidatus Methylumidiphilus sp.]